MTSKRDLRRKCVDDWAARGLFEVEAIREFIQSSKCPKWQREYFDNLDAVHDAINSEILLCFRSYTVEIVKANPGTISAPGYYSVEIEPDQDQEDDDGRKRNYVPIATVLEDFAMAKSALRLSLAHALGLLRRRCLPICDFDLELKKLVKRAANAIEHAVDRVQ